MCVHEFTPWWSPPIDWIDQIISNRYELIVERKPDLSVLQIDVSSRNWISPYHITTLACLVEEYSINNVEIVFVNPSPYLDKIRFIEYWNKGFNRNKFTQTQISTSLCLWHISEDMIFSYAQTAQQYFQNNYFQGSSLDSLNISLGEVFNNIFDHSESEIDGYVFTQYYPQKEQITTSICDFGLGIPKSINNFWREEGKNELPDEDALKAAMRKRVTSKSTPRNKGLGLDTLSSITNSLKSNLVILSNNALYNQSPELSVPKYRKLNLFFPGTLINLKLNTRFLPEIELEIGEDEFIF